MISHGKINGHYILHACVGCINTRKENVDALFELICSLVDKAKQ